MRYYPASRVLTGSITQGNEFSLNGKPYVGPYYRTYDNQYFSGNDPVTGDSDELTIISPSENTADSTTGYGLSTTGDAAAYNSLKNVQPLDILGFSPILPFYPVPTSQDYKRGFFFRYFAKKRNENGNLIETTLDVYNSLKKIDSTYNYQVYHAIELFWQLTGPLNDTVNTSNGVRTAGIVDTNRRLTDIKTNTFKGLADFIGGKYEKFSRPTV
jgi:hypothetical protein